VNETIIAGGSSQSITIWSFSTGQYVSSLKVYSGCESRDIKER